MVQSGGVGPQAVSVPAVFLGLGFCEEERPWMTRSGRGSWSRRIELSRGEDDGGTEWEGRGG